MRGIFDYRLPHAIDLEDAVKQAMDRRSEFYREARAEGGTDLVSQLKLGVKVRDPENRGEVIHKLSIQGQVIDWTEDGGNRKTELEGDIPPTVQAGAAGVWSEREPDAESGAGDGDGEAGGGTTREAVQIQSLDTWPIFD